MLGGMLTPFPNGGGGSAEPTFVSFSNVTSKTITHNLGYNPIVEVKDSNGDDCQYACHHDSNNQFTVTFFVPTSGVIRYI